MYVYIYISIYIYIHILNITIDKLNINMHIDNFDRPPACRVRRWRDATAMFHTKNCQTKNL